MLNVVLHWREHALRRMSAQAVVEDLEVFDERIRKFSAGAAPFTVEQLDPHPASERLDDGVDAPIVKESLTLGGGRR